MESRGCENITFFVNSNFSRNALFDGFMAQTTAGVFPFSLYGRRFFGRWKKLQPTKYFPKKKGKNKEKK